MRTYISVVLGVRSIEADTVNKGFLPRTRNIFFLSGGPISCNIARFILIIGWRIWEHVFVNQRPWGASTSTFSLRIRVAMYKRDKFFFRRKTPPVFSRVRIFAYRVHGFFPCKPLGSAYACISSPRLAEATSHPPNIVLLVIDKRRVSVVNRIR